VSAYGGSSKSVKDLTCCLSTGFSRVRSGPHGSHAREEVSPSQAFPEAGLSPFLRRAYPFSRGGPTPFPEAGRSHTQEEAGLQGYLAHQEPLPFWDHRRDIP